MVVTLIELDNILLFPLEKWESLIHCPRGFELSIDISSTVSRGRFVHQRQLIYQARFLRSICSSSPVDISRSVAHVTKLIHIFIAFLEDIHKASAISVDMKTELLKHQSFMKTKVSNQVE